MTYRHLIPIFLLALWLAGCGQAGTPVMPTSGEPQTLTVMTHDSFAISEGVLAAFEAENNAKVQFLKAGDTGTALNKAILSKDNPLADVFYGVDNTFLSRALEEGIFQPYSSPLLSEIPQWDDFEHVNELVAFCGLNPQKHTSGSSIHVKPRMSKKGSSRVRKGLYFPAIVAKNKNPILQVFAQRLL